MSYILFFSKLLTFQIIVIVTSIAIVVTAFILFFHFRKKRLKEAKTNLEEDIDAFIIKSVGGEENIISAEARLTRLTLQLIDLNQVDIASIEKRGIKIVLMESKITLLVGESAVSIASRLEKNTK